MNGSRYTAISSCCLVCLATCTGCEKPIPPGQAVSGIVRVESLPLEDGLVVLVPLSGTKGPRVTAPVRAGEFKLPAETGPWPGSYRVEINATPPELKALSAGKSMHNISAEQRQAFREIHDDFSASSKLKVQVQADVPNRFEFEVKWRP